MAVWINAGLAIFVASVVGAMMLMVCLFVVVVFVYVVALRVDDDDDDGGGGGAAAAAAALVTLRCSFLPPSLPSTRKREKKGKIPEKIDLQ